MAKENRNELFEYLQNIGNQAIRQFIEDQGIEDEVGYAKLWMKDNSKVRWKTGTHFIKMFELELKRLMTKKVIDIEMLGFLTLLSLYLNYEDSCLVKDGKYLNQKDIIEISGWSKNKVNKFLKEAIENDLLFEEKQEEDKRKSKYKLNAKLFYKGSKIDRDEKMYYDYEK